MRIPTYIQDAELNEVFNIIDSSAKDFVNEVRKCEYVSQDKEITRLLSETSLNQFLAITSVLKTPYNAMTMKNLHFDETDLFLDFEENDTEALGYLMQSWITLGSALESLLQIFLAVYLEQYQGSKWGVWENVNLEETKNQLLTLLNSLKDQGLIDQTQKDSLKDKIKKFLKSKSDVSHLESLTLSTLISFYNENIFAEDDKEPLNSAFHTIREYRNCVHSFRERNVGSWEELLNHLKMFASFIMDRTSCLPDVDDYLQYENEIKREIEGYYR